MFLTVCPNLIPDSVWSDDFFLSRVTKITHLVALICFLKVNLKVIFNFPPRAPRLSCGPHPWQPSTVFSAAAGQWGMGSNAMLFQGRLEAFLWRTCTVKSSKK